MRLTKQGEQMMPFNTSQNTGLDNPYAPKGGRRRPRGGGRSIEENPEEMWFRTMTTCLLKKGHLIVVNNKSNSTQDRNFVDDQLLQAASIHSIIANNTVAGREIGVINDECGFPPCTFSETAESTGATIMGLVQGWEDWGMPTLLNFPIKEPVSERDRRTAFMYAEGDLELFSQVEEQFLLFFDPSYYSACLGQSTDPNDEIQGSLRFFVQWELSELELAKGLGIDSSSPELDRITQILKHHSQPPPKQQRPKENGHRDLFRAVRQARLSEHQAIYEGEQL